MSEQVFFYIVILSILFFGLLNVFLDMKVYRKIVIQIKESNERIDNVWSQINRIDDEKKKTEECILICNKKIIDNYKELKEDILFVEKQRDEILDKERFDKNVVINRLNSHGKKIVYLKKVLDKLFENKVEVRHKAKLVKLAGELEKW